MFPGVAQSLVEACGDRLATAEAATEAGGNSIMQRARHSAVVSNGYVHEPPWKAVGAGDALAFLLGRAFSKRG